MCSPSRAAGPTGWTHWISSIASILIAVWSVHPHVCLCACLCVYMLACLHARTADGSTCHGFVLCCVWYSVDCLVGVVCLVVFCSIYSVGWQLLVRAVFRWVSCRGKVLFTQHHHQYSAGIAVLLCSSTQYYDRSDHGNCISGGKHQHEIRLYWIAIRQSTYLYWTHTQHALPWYGCQDFSILQGCFRPPRYFVGDQ